MAILLSFILGAVNVLTNTGDIYQTSGSGLFQNTLRPIASSSHAYTPLSFNMGDPLTNLYFSFNIVGYTNSFGEPLFTDDDFDYTFNFGINMPGDVHYNPTKPTLGMGWESDYTTSLGVRQVEWYMNFSGSLTNSHARPMGMVGMYDRFQTNTSVQFDWNAEAMNWNSGYGLPGISFTIDPNSKGNAASFLLGSFIAFAGNTNKLNIQTGNGPSLILDPLGGNILGWNTNYLTGLVIGDGARPLWLVGDIYLGKGKTIYFAPNNKYQSIGGNGSGEPMSYKDYSQHKFYTDTSADGGGTLRMAITSAGVFADNFYAQNFVNHAGSNLVQMIQDLQARIVALEQAK